MTTKTANLELVEVEDQDVGAGAAPGFNESYDKLDALVQLSVLSATTTTPPVSPRQGDRYIVPTTVTGGNAWTPFARRIAYYGADGWVFMTPKPGWEAYVVDVDRTFIFKTTDWVDIGFVLASTLTTKGDILASTGTAATRQAVGSNGQILFADSSKANGIDWKSLFTAKGQLLGFDGTNIVDLGVGTDGQILTADSTQTMGWKWAAAGGGGGGGTSYGLSYLDTVPGSPTIYDDEFLSGTGLDLTGARRVSANPWTLEQKQGNAPTIYSADFLKMDGTGGTDLIMLALQAVPAGAWEFTMKAMGPAGNASYYGPMLCIVNHAATSSNLDAMMSYGGSVYSQTNSYNSATKTWGFVSNNVQVTGFNGAAPYYLRISYPGSGTTYTLKYAQFSGAFAFKQTMTGFDPFSTLTTRSLASVTHICIGCADSAVLNYVDWFRRTA